MRRDADLLKEEADRAASRLGDAHVEKLVLGASNPVLAGDDADPLVELARLVGADVLGTAAFRAGLGDWAAQLSGALPGELRDLFGVDEASAETVLAQLAAEGAEEVLARLEAAQPTGSAD
jgi:hypothetical protein